MKSNFGKVIIVILALVAITGLLPVQSQALIFYGNRAEMPTNDFVDWGTFVSGIACSSQGVIVSVHNPMNFALFGGQNPFNLFGNFASGGNLLLTYGVTEITFNKPITSVGAEINSLWPFGSFTGTLEAYDANHVSLGSFSLAGSGPIFLGVVDPFDRIVSIDFIVSNIFLNFGFAINRLDFSRNEIPGDNDFPDNLVPLPGSLLLLGSSLIGLGGFHYKKS
jgi:hypothetical protein